MFAVMQWNFPFFLAVGKVAPAVAAGCTMILKPAEQTPLSAIYLAALVKEVGYQLELCLHWKLLCVDMMRFDACQNLMTLGHCNMFSCCNNK